MMDDEFGLLEVDYITAQMYGQHVPMRQNDIPFSKNGIESFDELDSEINEIFEMLEKTVFTSKDNTWKNSFLK